MKEPFPEVLNLLHTNGEMTIYPLDLRRWMEEVQRRIEALENE